MKALSLYQPWAWLITTPDPKRPRFPIKDVENRLWRLPVLFTVPQRIYIHASATWVDIPAQIHQRLEQRGIYIPDKKELPQGAIVGEVSITASSRDSKSEWADTGRWAFELEYPTAYETPIPCKGQQRFWEPPSDIMEPTIHKEQFDCCECGDYRQDHDLETGRCRMPDNMAHGMKPCLGFRLFHMASEIPEPFRSS